MRIRGLIVLSMLALCSGAFGALTNEAEFVDQDWSSNMDVNLITTDGAATNRVGFNTTTGENGINPSVTNGVLSLTMVGATGGVSRVSTIGLNAYDFFSATNYIVTTRLKVTQFPDSDFSNTTLAAGIDFFDIRGMDRLYIHLEPDGVWVQQGNNDWDLAASLVTVEGTYYTWQFEVRQVAGSGAGTVSIYRRTSDLDAWTTVASDVAIRGIDNLDQWVINPVNFNGDNAQLQGVVDSDYLQIGALIDASDAPPPAASYETWIEQDWSSSRDIYLVTNDGTATNKVGFNLTTGTDGTAPSVGEGVLTLTMGGSTAGKTQLSTGIIDSYEPSTATNYNVTTRMKVIQFPDSDFGAATADAGINFFDIRGMDRLYIHLESDGLWVQQGNNDWDLAALITTAENTYYTWQFEVSQVAGAGAGTVDIYRRTLDTDVWTTVATNVAIRDSDNGDQWIINTIHYNADNTQIQGVVESDYLQIGYPFSSTDYERWADSYGLTGTDALQTTDVEPDGMDNLTEYALGGNPTNDDAVAVLPTSGTIEEAGTNWFEYIYNRRKNYVAFDLEYNVETIDDLVFGMWTNDNYTVSGVGSIDADFEAVTNRIDIGLSGEYFIRLLIQEN